DAHAKFRVAEFCEVALESVQHRAADESGGVQRFAKHGNQFGFQLAMGSYQVDKWHFAVLSHLLTLASVSMDRRIFAGFPATIVLAGTSRVTTLPAPTIAFSPTTTLQRIVAPDPMEAPFLITVDSTRQSASV